MKQVLQNFRSGELMLQEVSRPQPRAGWVLVRNLHSVISTGTEGGTVRLGRKSLLGKARARPEQVAKVLGAIKSEGLWTTYQAVTRTLNVPMPLGYSCAGVVVDAGGHQSLRPGDLVACGGGALAVHAEYVLVPHNLCVKAPEGVSSRHASFATLGAIAMQGVRQARVSLGERAVVIGLGLVGLLIVQLLKAAGCRVLGVDSDPERVRFAEENAFCQAAARDLPNLLERAKAFGNGFGADCVLVAAAAPTNDPVALAGEMARPKGRVVVVGRTEMTAPRETYLFKELELTTSMAYGPGQGDPTYEQQGQDYPYAFVRWTENRNMGSFLELVAGGQVSLDPMITHEFPLERALEAYDVVTGKAGEPSLAVLLAYPPEPAAEPARIALPAAAKQDGQLGVGVIGAGSFATNFLVPLLHKAEGLRLAGTCSATGVRARALGEQYGAAFCASEPAEVINDPDTHCVFVLTRHDSHAPLAIQALKAGKHVFVEKPLAMTLDQLREIARLQRETGLMVMVGFNRTFAPLSRRLAEFLGRRAQPLSALVRANVGYRPLEHWLHDPEQGGGLMLGEACHFVDYAHWLAKSDPVEVSAWSLAGGDTGLIGPDNQHVSLRFADGSVASVLYISCGDPAAGRERVEVMADNATAVLEDWGSLVTHRSGRKRAHRSPLTTDRGHTDEIQAFISAVRGGDDGPRICRQHLLSMLATLKAVESLQAGEPRRIQPERLEREKE
jgi:predicted dehydrogenase